MARRVYTSEKINVSFDASLCVHTANCLRGLPQVFDLEAKPWISPGAADASTIAAVVERCPSGALQYERLDGGAQEQPESEPVIYAAQNGPLMVRGDVKLLDPDGHELSNGFRMTKASPTFCPGPAKLKPLTANTPATASFSLSR